MESSWKPAHKIVCQGSTLGTVLGTTPFNNPVNGRDGGAGWTHSRFADNTELEEWLLPQMSVLPMRGAICENGSIGKFNREIRNSLHMGKVNPNTVWVPTSRKLCLE